MSPSPEMAKAFKAWQMAELATHYAIPCPDSVMDALVNDASDRLDALNRTPPATADDLVLKLFPLLLWVFEPKPGDPPLYPMITEAVGTNIVDGYRAMIRDIGRVSPLVAMAMQAPHRLAQDEQRHRLWGSRGQMSVAPRDGERSEAE